MADSHGPQDDAGFARRHIGIDPDSREAMLDAVGFASLEELVDTAVPASIRQPEPLSLPPPGSEADVLDRLRALAGRNDRVTSYLGLGYAGTVTPPVIRRMILENPAWYTAYTPYQSEISQGRLELLLAFQTMVTELTGMEIANASLLDEATAAAEAMAMSHRIAGGGDVFLVDHDAHPATVAVIRTRAEPLGLRVRQVDPAGALTDMDGIDAGAVFGILLQQPGTSGALRDLGELTRRYQAADVLVTVAADLLALCVVEPPGRSGADIVVGSSQRFGVPMMFGGPHAAFLATRERHRRSLPGRLVGVSVDRHGDRAYRLALQTREQHIRRERATSNICTSQVLLAVVAAAYAMYHGPDGLAAIARRVHGHTARLARGLERPGTEVVNDTYFDTLTVRMPGRANDVVAAAWEAGYNLRRVDRDTFALTLDETTDADDVDALCKVLGIEAGVAASAPGTDELAGIPADMRRTDPPLEHEMFSRFRSETEMLRYLRRLADRDLALDRTMIPLGSCTMKLNATAELEAVTWPAFAELHPHAPLEQAEGTITLIEELEAMLAEITGYDRVSVQPNAGSQGELAGLLAIRAYHRDRGEAGRDVCLIPSSAHGTNAASAAMAGMRVVVVDCDEDGNVDVDHCAQLAAEHAEDLAALMVTYPSTHGVFETTIRELCGLVHEHGGQVYLDGANLNALVGIARPGEFGADVSHLNLHKTFCIPHGGGGPGVGPVAVREHLAPFLPNHPQQPAAGPASGIGPISQAPWGSAGILQISWAYIRLMGADGLRRATGAAILAANYVAHRLEEHYPVLYRGAGDTVAHECIIDLRPIQQRTGIDNEDVAKRLVDYGFHAPTMSFPVAGTLMIEPTESEPKHELDRFCDAMVAIRGEIERVADGEWPEDDNPLVNAPHTARELAGEWRHPYSRAEAAYPRGVEPADKYWPPVARVDNAYGDRNLVCTCPPVESYRRS